MKRFFLLISLIFIVTNISFSQNRTYYDNLKKSKKNSITYSKELLTSLQSNNKNELDRLLLIREQIRKQTEIVQIIGKEILLLNEEIQIDENRITDLNKKLESVKKEYAQLIYFSSLNMGIQRRMIYILSAESFNKAYKRIIYLKQLSDFRKSRGEEITKSIQSIDSTVANLKELKLAKESLIGEKSAELDSLSGIKSKLNKVIGNNQQKIDNIKSQLNREQEKNTVIKKKVITEIENQKQNNEIVISKKSPKLDGNITKKFEDQRRRLIWPLEKFVVLHHYGDYYHPELQNIIVKNDGIELGSSPGKHVHAVFDGSVISVIPIPGDGTSIIIRHGDYFSVYSKVERPLVKPGDVVGKGQVIANLGNDGKMTKMAFQLWHNKEKLNPELWLKRQ